MDPKDFAFLWHVKELGSPWRATEGSGIQHGALFLWFTFNILFDASKEHMNSGHLIYITENSD